MTTIHVDSVVAWQIVLATSMLGFEKNSRGTLLSEMKLKAESRFAKASAYLFSS